jgi:hypothetical protein
MNDTARRLRAQIATSTDPDWLERMALHAEGVAAADQVPAPAPRHATVTGPALSDPITNLSAPVEATGGTRGQDSALSIERGLD